MSFSYIACFKNEHKCSGETKSVNSQYSTKEDINNQNKQITVQEHTVLQLLFILWFRPQHHKRRPLWPNIGGSIVHSLSSCSSSSFTSSSSTSALPLSLPASSPLFSPIYSLTLPPLSPTPLPLILSAVFSSTLVYTKEQT